jgi:hypothetical protein
MIDMFAPNGVLSHRYVTLPFLSQLETRMHDAQARCPLCLRSRWDTTSDLFLVGIWGLLLDAARLGAPTSP